MDPAALELRIMGEKKRCICPPQRERGAGYRYNLHCPFTLLVDSYIFIRLAKSEDGVHWVDDGINMRPWGVNPCRNKTMNASHPVAGIGSGSVWESPTVKGLYVINYSEDIKGNPFGQQIRFSTSRDLKAWAPVSLPPFQ